MQFSTNYELFEERPAAIYMLNDQPSYVPDMVQTSHFGAFVVTGLQELLESEHIQLRPTLVLSWAV